MASPGQRLLVSWWPCIRPASRRRWFVVAFSWVARRAEESRAPVAPPGSPLADGGTHLAQSLVWRSCTAVTTSAWILPFVAMMPTTCRQRPRRVKKSAVPQAPRHPPASRLPPLYPLVDRAERASHGAIDQGIDPSIGRNVVVVDDDDSSNPRLFRLLSPYGLAHQLPPVSEKRGGALFGRWGATRTHLPR